MAKQRIVITGASGFIGTSLADVLAGSNYNITAIDLIQPHVKHKGVQYRTGNFANLAFLDGILDPGDIIIHLACTSVPESSEKYPQKDKYENEESTTSLLDMAVKKKVKSIIYFSSGGTVYGAQGRGPIKESAKLKPINSHGKMKLGIENIITKYHKKEGLNYIILRPGNPYGWTFDRKINQGIIDVFLRCIANDKELFVWGDGSIVRDYLHISDLVDIVAKVLEKEVLNEVFNVGSGVGTSINELIQIIKDIANKKISINYLNPREYDVERNVLDINKAALMLGWEPRISLKDGIKNVYTSLKTTN